MALSDNFPQIPVFFGTPCKLGQLLIGGAFVIKQSSSNQELAKLVKQTNNGKWSIDGLNLLRLGLNQFRIQRLSSYIQLSLEHLFLCSFSTSEKKWKRPKHFPT